MRRGLLLVLALSLGIAVGVWSRSVPSPASASNERIGQDPPDALDDTGSANPLASSHATLRSPTPGAAHDGAPSTPLPTSAPLPKGGPIAALLPELRERARSGDVAAARRAHRELFFCENARAIAAASTPRDPRVRCVAERLCTGLQDADFDEAGGLLLRAAELGDVEAMAAVAEGFAIGLRFSGPNLSASQALAPRYLRRGLEAAVPMSLANAYTACWAPDLFSLQPFRRSLSAEEQYAWGVAVLQIPGSSPAGPTLARMRETCAQKLDPLTLQRAEAEGLRLHARFLSHLQDRERLGRSTAAELGVPHYDDNDPRLQDWPQCVTSS